MQKKFKTLSITVFVVITVLATLLFPIPVQAKVFEGTFAIPESIQNFSIPFNGTLAVENFTLKLDNIDINAERADLEVMMHTVQNNVISKLTVNIYLENCQVTSEQFNMSFSTLTIHVDAKNTDSQVNYTVTASKTVSMFQLLTGTT